MVPGRIMAKEEEVVDKNDRSPNQGLPPPSGCRWCGVEPREHFQRWEPSAGWHQWEEPTPQQRKERILARLKNSRRKNRSNSQTAFIRQAVATRRTLHATA